MRISLLLLASFSVSTAFAGDAAYEAAYAELKGYIAPYTYVTTSPAYVYNWHSELDDKDFSKNSDDPKAYEALKKIARKYWDKQDEPNGSMFGTGLYAALDPVATRSYGGQNSKKWVLTQIRVPSGFRMLDAMRDGGFSLPFHRRDILSKLGCPEVLVKRPLMQSLLNPGTYKGHPKCGEMVRRLFKEDLKIDGFTYGYYATSYRDCAKPAANAEYSMRSAFVITEDRLLIPENVRVYNYLTEGDETSRARIQSLFTRAKVQQVGANYSSGADDTSDVLTKHLNKVGFPQYAPWIPNKIYSSMFTTSSGGKRVSYTTSILCDRARAGSSGEKFTSGALPGSDDTISQPMQCVEVIAKKDELESAAAEPENLSAEKKYGEFLWQNLEGKPFTPKLTEWMKKNLYSCDENDSYRPLYKPTKGPAVSEEEDDAEIPVEPANIESAK